MIFHKGQRVVMVNNTICDACEIDEGEIGVVYKDVIINSEEEIQEHEDLLTTVDVIWEKYSTRRHDHFGPSGYCWTVKWKTIKPANFESLCKKCSNTCKSSYMYECEGYEEAI